MFFTGLAPRRRPTQPQHRFPQEAFSDPTGNALTRPHILWFTALVCCLMLTGLYTACLPYPALPERDAPLEQGHCLSLLRPEAYECLTRTRQTHLPITERVSSSAPFTFSTSI